VSDAQIKAAFAEQVERLGRIAAAAERLGLSPAQIGRLVRSGDEAMPSAALALRADRLAGEPVVTRTMAYLLGYRLEPLSADEDRRQLLGRAAGAARAAGELMGEVVEDIADGVLTPHERARIRARLSALETETAAMRQALGE